MGSPPSQYQHCTDEAQKAETVLSAVSYTYKNILVTNSSSYIFFKIFARL